MSRPVVDVICVGSIVRDGKRVVEAHSTCTLVRSKKHSILVDTTDDVYRHRLIDGIQMLGLEPKDIDIVVNTHSHYDHNSNNDLFPMAELIAHQLDRPRGRFTAMTDDSMAIDDGVRLVHTPGHSPGSISLFVEGERRTVVAGDAIPTEDNYLKDLPPAHHSDIDQAISSMRIILGWADVVVPGHGPAFVIKH